MPKFRAKKIVLLLVLVGLMPQWLRAQPPARLAARADSLFNAGQPLAAHQLYRRLLRQRLVSREQLLRLAAVEESRDRYASALFYLNLYQEFYPSSTVWSKMAELAAAHRLTGYPDTWRQHLGLTLRRSYPALRQGLLAVAVAAGTLLLLRRRRAGRSWWLAYGMYLGLAGAVLNVLPTASPGLVCRPRAALMSAPSAAGSWLTTVAAGDRLQVQGRQDIWYRVLWRGRTAYIRQHDLLLVE